MRTLSIAVLFSSWSGVAMAQSSSTTSATTGLLQIVAALGVVIAVMLAMTWFMKRFSGLSPLQRLPMKVISAVSLGNRERVVVIEVADQCLVLGVTPQQITMLSSLPKPVVAPIQTDSAEPAIANRTFTDWLKTSLEKRTRSVSQD